MANSKVEKAIEKKKYGVLEKLAGGRDEEIRLEAIKGMGKVAGEESFHYLTGALRSPEAKVRAAAAEGLGEMKDPKARAFLEHQMRNEEDEAARQCAREALAQVREAH